MLILSLHKDDDYGEQGGGQNGVRPDPWGGRLFRAIGTRRVFRVHIHNIITPFQPESGQVEYILYPVLPYFIPGCQAYGATTLQPRINI